MAKGSSLIAGGMLCTLFAMPGFAEPAPQPLTIDRAVAIALRQHPLLASAQDLEQVGTARLDQDAARGLPQLSAGGILQTGMPGAKFNIALPDVGDPAASPNNGIVGTSRKSNFGLGLTLGQTLWSPGLAAQTQADRYSLEALKLGTKAQAADTIRSVKLAYLEALRTREQLGLAQKIVRERKLTLDQANALAKAGLSSKLDAEQAQVRLEDANAQALQAKTDADVAYQALVTSMGDDPAKLPTWQLMAVASGSIAEVGIPANASITTNPYVQLAQSRLTLARAQVELTQSAGLPQADAFLSAGWADVPPLNYSTAWSSPQYAAGVGISVPIFTSGLIGAQVREAEARQRYAESSAEAVGQSADQAFGTAELSLTQDRAQLSVLSSQIQAARHALQLARERYRYQLASFLDVVAAETAEAAVETRWVDENYALQRDQTVLAYVLGSDLARYRR